jgi:hypothetical protein
MRRSEVRVASGELLLHPRGRDILTVLMLAGVAYLHRAGRAGRIGSPVKGETLAASFE